ncbi:MAG: hypothetical protein HeimC3_44420 [Candidatus Heimdallarchaeota archaeon LC_3]|nr:MAG: hypothetical protein HeimC3_44420 [Candidatus Heimdallarchaeota archaeon LC_3]
MNLNLLLIAVILVCKHKWLLARADQLTGFFSFQYKKKSKSTQPLATCSIVENLTFLAVRR